MDDVAEDINDMDSGFDLNSYVPKLVDGCEVFDRGSNESDAQYCIMRDGSASYAIISAQDKAIFDLIDGKKAVNDVCSEYLMKHQQLVLPRMYALIQKLWLGGFLEEGVGVEFLELA